MNDEEILKRIREIKWRYLVNRKEALLCRSFTDGSYEHFKDATHFDWQVNFLLYPATGELMHTEKEYRKLESFMEENGLKFFKEFEKILIKVISEYDNLSKEIENIDCSKLSDKELLELLEKFVLKGLHSHAFLAPMPVADKIISENILDSLPKSSEKQKQEWLGILAFPSKENDHVSEERNFYKLVKAYKNKDSNFDSLLKNHLKDYSRIGARWYWFQNAWKKEDVIKRIENFLSLSKDPDESLKELENFRKTQEKKFEDLVKELEIDKNSELFEYIKLAQEYAYLRTWRTDVCYSAGFRGRNLYYEVVKRSGLNELDCLYITCHELLDCAKTKKSPISNEELTRRKECYVTAKLDGNFYVLSGEKWAEKINEVVKKDFSGITKVKGTTAYKGNIKGKAKLVMKVEDVSKVEKGDILIAVMTFPHFIPAMEKAAAFVTDEGGILCHAAIVSREMNKPCVIGTKNATQIFKDNDLIEVDATNGIVRILK